MSSTLVVLELAFVREFYRLFGQEWFVDTYGTLPSLALLTTVFMLVGSVPLVFDSDVSGRVRALAGRRKIPSRQGDGSSTTGPERDVRDEDGQLVTEAIRRLERENESLTGEALQDQLAEIEREQGADGSVTSGAVPTERQRSETERVSVAPSRIVESKSYVKRFGDDGNQKFARTVILSEYPSRVSVGWLDTLFTSGLSTKGAEVRVSYQIWPRDAQTMKRKLNIRATRLSTQIEEKRRDGKLNTIEEEKKLEHVNRLRDELTAGTAKLFDFALYFEVLAEDEESLDDATQELKQNLSRSNARIATLFDRQLQAQRAIAPLADDPIRKTQVMDQRALATTFPFTDPTIVQPTGVLMGFHTATNSPIVVDRFEQSGHNMLVTGKIGSGKSYLSKLAMWRRLMIDPDSEVLIIDPVGGFGDIVDAVDGQRVTISSDTVINPMEIKRVDDRDETDSNPYDDKIRSVMGMFESHFEGKRELSKEEEGVLRKAIRLAYLQKGITKDPATHGRESPVLGEVLTILQQMADGVDIGEIIDVREEHEELLATIAPEFGATRRQSDDETTSASVNRHTSGADASGSNKNEQRISEFAHSVLLGLEDFQPGGQRANLNGVTNVELNDRVVQFDLSNVADGRNEGLLMHIVLDWLFQRAKTNQGNMIVVIDEAHYMLGHEQSLDMLNLFARHSRHYNSGLTLISQTVDEFLNSEKAKEIYDQCDIRALMRHQDISDEACEALGLTERERDFVLQAQAGNSAPYSESLLYVTDVGKMRMRVLSNEFEHTVVDGGTDAWEQLLDQGLVDPSDVPAAKRPDRSSRSTPHSRPGGLD